MHLLAIVSASALQFFRLLNTQAGKLRAKYDRWLEGSSPSATSSEDERRTRKLADKSLYDIIGIDRRSTVEEIKEAAQSAVSR